MAAQLQHEAVARSHDPQIGKDKPGDRSARRRPLLAVVAHDLDGVVEIRRGPADVQDNTRSENLYAGRFCKRSLEALAEDLGCRSNPLGQIAPQLAHALLVYEVVEVGAAHRLENTEPAARQGFGQRIGDDTRPGEKLDEKSGEVAVSGVRKGAESVASGLEPSQSPLERGGIGTVDATAHEQHVDASQAAALLVEIVDEDRVGSGEQYLVAQGGTAVVLGKAHDADAQTSVGRRAHHNVFGLRRDS